MKKKPPTFLFIHTLRLATGFLLAMLLCNSVCAGDFDELQGFDELPRPEQTKFHPVVSLYYPYLQIDTFVNGPGGVRVARLPSQYNGLGMLGGFKYGCYIGIFLGYEYYFNKERITTLDNGNSHAVSMRPNMTYFEIRGYYPILNIEGLSIVGAAGAEINDFSFFDNLLHAAFDQYRNNLNVNLRMGLGAEYYLTRHWGIWTMWTYVPNHVNFRHVGGWDELWTVNL